MAFFIFLMLVGFAVWYLIAYGFSAMLQWLKGKLCSKKNKDKDIKIIKVRKLTDTTNEEEHITNDK